MARRSSPAGRAAAGRNPRLTPEAARLLLTGAARVDSFARHPFDGGTDGRRTRRGLRQALRPGGAGRAGRRVRRRINVSENPVPARRSCSTIRGGAAGRHLHVSRARSSGNSPLSGHPPAVGSDHGDGRPVINGVYIVVVDLGGSVLRHRRTSPGDRHECGTRPWCSALAAAGLGGWSRGPGAVHRDNGGCGAHAPATARALGLAARTRRGRRRGSVFVNPAGWLPSGKWRWA